MASLLTLRMDDLILHVLMNYVSNPKLICASCQVVRYVGVEVYTFFRDRAGQAIISAMKRHPSNPRVQEAGCYVIRQLGRLKINAVKLVSPEYQVDEVLSKALQLHLKDAEVQKAACSAVWSLSIHEAPKRFLWSKGVTKLVVNALNSHQKNQKLQLYGIQVLRMSPAMYSVVHMGGGKVVVQAIKNHIKDPNVVEPALRTLKDMCNYKSNAETIYHCGGCVAIVQALLANHKKEALPYYGMLCIYQMSLLESTRNGLLQAKVELVFDLILTTALHTKLPHPGLVPLCLYCIEKFSLDEPTVRKFLKFISKIGRLTEKYLAAKEFAIVERCLTTLSAFSDQTGEANIPIKSAIMRILLDLSNMAEREISSISSRLLEKLEN